MIEISFGYVKWSMSVFRIKCFIKADQNHSFALI